jgi:hypothetical protein
LKVPPPAKRYCASVMVFFNHVPLKNEGVRLGVPPYGRLSGRKRAFESKWVPDHSK